MRSWLPILTTALAFEIYTAPLNYASKESLRNAWAKGTQECQKSADVVIP